MQEVDIDMRKKLGRRLAYLRTRKKITQADAAEFSHMAKSTYSLIELGERDISFIQLLRLTKLYETSIDGLMSAISSNDETRLKNYANILLMMVSLCVKQSKKPVKINKLMALTCLADLMSIANTGQIITEQKYRKTPYGAVPDLFFAAISMLDNGGCVSISGYGGERYLWSTEAGLVHEITNRDYVSVEKIAVELSQRQTLDLLDIIKAQPLWAECADYGILCMDNIDYSFRQFAYGVYNFDEMILQLHKTKVNKL